MTRYVTMFNLLFVIGGCAVEHAGRPHALADVLVVAKRNDGGALELMCPQEERWSYPGITPRAKELGIRFSLAHPDEWLIGPVARSTYPSPQAVVAALTTDSVRWEPGYHWWRVSDGERPFSPQLRPRWWVIHDGHVRGFADQRQLLAGLARIAIRSAGANNTPPASTDSVSASDPPRNGYVMRVRLDGRVETMAVEEFAATVAPRSWGGDHPVASTSRMALHGFVAAALYDSMPSAIGAIEDGTAFGAPCARYSVWELPPRATRRMRRYVPDN